MSGPYTSPLPQRPPSSSPASTVRAYFTAILHQLHGMPEPQAASIAAAWKLGRGSELVSYDLQTFRDLFGSEAGMLLFNYARGDDLDQDPARARTVAQRIAPTPRRTLFGVEPDYVLVEFFFLATVYFAVTAYRDSNLNHPEHATAIAGILGSNTFMAASAFVISYVLYSNFFNSGKK